MEHVVIIPVLNPSNRLLSVVSGLQSEGFDKFIVVDDGSSEEYQSVFDILEKRGIFVVHHSTNLGKGSALRTGFCWIRHLYPNAAGFVTCDGDGQHLPSDVRRVCEVATKVGDSLVLGTRDFRSLGVPSRSRFGNSFSSLYFKMDTGFSCPDTQTGLRCIPMSLLAEAMRTPGSRYDYEMNFLTRVAKSNTGIVGVPITTVYEDNNKTSHFRAIADSALIYRQFIRFACSSLACSAVDLLLFALITVLLGTRTAGVVALATIAARIGSGLLNFTLNRTWAFNANSTRHKLVQSQALRYAALYLFIMLSSMGLVSALAFLPLPLVVVKAIVDSCLFFVSYLAQRNWVFREKSVRKTKESDAYVAHNAFIRIA